MLLKMWKTQQRKLIKNLYPSTQTTCNMYHTCKYLFHLQGYFTKIWYSKKVFSLHYVRPGLRCEVTSRLANLENCQPGGDSLYAFFNSGGISVTLRKNLPIFSDLRSRKPGDSGYSHEFRRGWQKQNNIMNHDTCTCTVQYKRNNWVKLQ
jgi:hypothetical protein